MQIGKETKKLINKSRKQLDNLGLTQSKDGIQGNYRFHCISNVTRSDTQHIVRLTLPLKGNKKIIDYLVFQGWTKAKCYVNGTGGTSIWESKEFYKRENHRRNVFMAVLNHPAE